MDTIVPGGVARDLDRGGRSARLRGEIDALEKAVAALKYIYDEHAGLQDRFINCGRVAPELADRLGLTGIAGRASGAGVGPARPAIRRIPYQELDVRMATHRNGDVAARVTVRFEEIFESLRLIAADPGAPAVRARSPSPVPAPPEGAFGAGWVEGWRGEVFVALEAGPGGTHPPLPSARSVVAELAAARARGARQHRSRFPAHQQVVQPVVQRPRLVTHAAESESESSKPAHAHRSADSQPGAWRMPCTTC